MQEFFFCLFINKEWDNNFIDSNRARAKIPFIASPSTALYNSFSQREKEASAALQQLHKLLIYCYVIGRARGSSASID